MPKRLQEVQIPPGFVDGTPREIKQRYLKGNLIRFRDGRLRPIGGWSEFPLSRFSESIDSEIRGHLQWRANNNFGLMALGTAGSGAPNYGKLYVMEVTNRTELTDATADTTSGSDQVTVDDASEYEVGDEVAGSGIPTGSTITAISTNTLTISANATATATNITLTVTPRANHQRLYDITPSGYQATGDSEFRPGFGTWFYGSDVEFGYSYSGPGSVVFSRAAHWSLDSFGQNLIGVQSGDKGIFYFDSSDLTTAAEEITTANGYTETAPTAVAVLVTPERHVLALGADGDARQIKWSSQETVDVWSPAATNSAGDLSLQTSGYIVTARRVPQGTAIWTDQDLHLLTYTGAPLFFGVQKLADSAGAISPYSVYSSTEVTTWLNRGGFWTFDGYARPVSDCPIQDRVMRTVDWSQEGLIYSGGNSEFGEVWWFCPSVTGTAGQCSYYVVWNYRENVWYDSLPSGIARNCWIDRGVLTSPIAVDPSDNTIYAHEVTNPSQTDVAEAETGAIDVMMGERYSRISKVFSDSDQQAAGAINFQFYTAASGDAAETTSSSYPLETDGEIDVRLQGRQVRYRVTGALTQDWTVGNTRFETHVGGRR
jgi:hypothetical protein